MPNKPEQAEAPEEPNSIGDLISKAFMKAETDTLQWVTFDKKAKKACIPQV